MTFCIAEGVCYKIYSFRQVPDAFSPVAAAVNFGQTHDAFKVLQMYPDLYAEFDIQRRRIASEYNKVCREIRLAVENCGADSALKKHETETRITIVRQVCLCESFRISKMIASEFR